MKKLTILSILLLSMVRLGAQDVSTPFIRIGSKDGGHDEFALGIGQYRSIPDKFPGSVAVWTAGSSAASSIPFAVPGPSDSWAGRPEGTIVLGFNAPASADGAAVRLRMDFVEVHSADAPRLEIGLNGWTCAQRLAAGSNQDYLDNGRTFSEGLFFEADIPAGVLRAGDNMLTIRSVAGSWYVLDAITLSSDRSFKVSAPARKAALVSAKARPGLVYGKSKEELLRPVDLVAINWRRKPLKTSWSAGDALSSGIVALSPGVNTIRAWLPESAPGGPSAFSLAAAPGETLSVEVPAYAPWTIYLVQHTHTDIGYTRPQTEILAEHLRYIDYALEYCELTDSYPDDSRFRWTCEASWAVDEWLRNRPEEQVGKFLEYVRQGRIEVTAMYFNMSELSGEHNYKTFLEPVGRFHALGIPVSTAMQDDVNGVAWCLADYLPDTGVKYLTMGSNGHRANIPFDMPTVYRWESPSGKSLLSYRADHYNTGNFWGIERGDLATFENGVFSYISSLEGCGYPFKMVGVQYSGYFTDNSPPSRHESDLIRAWNEKYAWPKLRSATVHEFLEAVEEAHGAELPAYRLAYPDYWTDGFGSAARETAASRKTQADAVVMEGMLSMAALSGDADVAGYADELHAIHEGLLFYDEHTFGAAESIWDPACENSQVQWAEKGSYVWDALKRTQMMYEIADGRLQGRIFRGENGTVTFFNTQGWKRSGLVRIFIDNDIVPPGVPFDLVAEDGTTIGLQQTEARNEGRFFLAWAEDIPAMGWKTYEVRLGTGSLHGTEWKTMDGYDFENDFYALAFDPAKGGLTRLYDKEEGIELVDGEAEWNLGSPVYESLEGDRHQMERKVFEKYSRTTLKDVRYTGVASGDIFTTVSFEGRLPGCDPRFGVKVDVDIYHKVKRVGLSYRLKRLPETDPSGIYVAFPFGVEDGELSFDVPGGTVRAAVDQLPGTVAAWNTVQSFVSASNSRMQVLLGTGTIPLFMLGELLDDPYRADHGHDRTHVFSWVMNNYWTTNFRASQEGELRWDYALTSTAGRSVAEASCFGLDNRIPIHARVLPPAVRTNGLPREKSFFSLPGGFQLNYLTPSAKERGAVLANIREIAGERASLSLCTPEGGVLKFTKVNVLDEPMGPATTSMQVGAHENIFIRIETSVEPWQD